MLLSRMAERVFWLGRCLARAEDLARAILAHSHMCLDMPSDAASGFAPLLELCEGRLPSSSSDGRSGLLSILSALVLDRANTASLIGVVDRARENARACRAFIPEETWDTLNPCYLTLLDLADQPTVVAIEEAVQEVIAACQQINTQLAEGMARDEAYLFVQIGRNIERADMLLRVTQVSELLSDERGRDAPFADVRWMGMLYSQNAYQVYRREHRGRADFASTLCFLLGNQKFPRSLWFSLSEVSRALAELPHSALLVDQCEALRSFALPRKPTDPRDYAEGLLNGLSALSDRVLATYFSEAQPEAAVH